jgi:hypothetical protein
LHSYVVVNQDLNFFGDDDDVRTWDKVPENRPPRGGPTLGLGGPGPPSSKIFPKKKNIFKNLKIKILPSNFLIFLVLSLQIFYF